MEQVDLYFVPFWSEVKPVSGALMSSIALGVVDYCFILDINLLFFLCDFQQVYLAKKCVVMFHNHSVVVGNRVLSNILV